MQPKGADLSLRMPTDRTDADKRLARLEQVIHEYQATKRRQAAQRIINLFHSWRSQLIRYLDQLGLQTLLDLRGRTDLLEYV